MGYYVGSEKRRQRGGALTKEVIYSPTDDPLLTEIGKLTNPQSPPPQPEAPSSATLTKAQWKEKMARHFLWYPGMPVTGPTVRFQQVMGKPERTQTIGDQAYWYYRCADGVIQMRMHALNAQVGGMLQAEVNDY